MLFTCANSHRFAHERLQNQFACAKAGSFSHGEGKYVILADDAAYTQDSFESHIIPGFAVDVREAEKSLDWLCACRKEPACIVVFPNHDSSVAEQVIEL